jgi:PHD/YefM family antitoxin component YafN of YafNO toxin-antitoxin module
MNSLTAQEIKRRGMGAVDGLLAGGPVYVIKNNRPRYVVLREEDYSGLLSELSESRLAASEADWAEGRVQHGTAADLMRELSRKKQ